MLISKILRIFNVIISNIIANAHRFGPRTTRTARIQGHTLMTLRSIGIELAVSLHFSNHLTELLDTAFASLRSPK